MITRIDQYFKKQIDDMDQEMVFDESNDILDFMIDGDTFSLDLGVELDDYDSNDEDRALDQLADVVDDATYGYDVD